MTESTNQTSTQNITDRTIAISLTMRRPGCRKKVATSKVSVDADPALISVSKRLLECKEYEKIVSHYNVVKAYIKARALPSMFREGVYLVPIPLVQDFDAYLIQQSVALAPLLDELLAVYSQAQAEDERRLRDVYDPRDYPPPAVLRGAFSIAWQWITFNTPGRLSSIAPEMFQREKDKAEMQWKSATDEITSLMRESFSQLVDHLVDRLTPNQDGSRKKFHDSAVGNLQQWLDLFDLRNVTDDAQLAALVQRARTLTNGVEGDDLRTPSRFRDRIIEEFKSVQSSLDNLIVNRPRRRIMLDEEEG